MKNQDYVVACQWLSQWLNDPDVAVIDCRFYLGEPGRGFASYMSGHIPGALYFDLERDLSGPQGAHGGRHPLPTVKSLKSLFSSAGINEQVFVVAYDDQDMAMAARLWWLLHYCGHKKVGILNGGFQMWRSQGLPVIDTVVPRPARRFVPRVQPGMLVDIEHVKKRRKGSALLDSRAGERYTGDIEPLDLKAGHIPGALNYPYKENLNFDGTMKSLEELRKRFDAVVKTSEIIAYCGSGVTGCVNVLALYRVGRTDAKLYAGSWSDWCSYDLPVEQGS